MMNEQDSELGFSWKNVMSSSIAYFSSYGNSYKMDCEIQFRTLCMYIALQQWKSKDRYIILHSKDIWAGLRDIWVQDFSVHT